MVKKVFKKFENDNYCLIKSIYKLDRYDSSVLHARSTCDIVGYYFNTKHYKKMDRL